MRLAFNKGTQQSLRHPSLLVSYAAGLSSVTAQRMHRFTKGTVILLPMSLNTRQSTLQA
jgi:hypothetical protein